MRSPNEPHDVGRLKKRADFVRVSKGRRWHGKSVSVQAGRQDAGPGDASAPRVGFTLTKKVGCAVIRNRARRRLREALRLSPDIAVKSGYDYVFVGRLEAIRIDFAELRNEMSRAVRGVHDEARAASRQSGGTGTRKPRVKP